MSIKRTMLSIASGVVMFAPLVGNVHALTVNCSSNQGTMVSVVSSNVSMTSQTVMQSNNTGGNVTMGNIGGGGIRTGRTRSVANLSTGGNSNGTMLTLTGGGSTNTCSVVNTGK